MSVIVIIAIVVAADRFGFCGGLWSDAAASRDRSCGSGGLQKPPDTVKRPSPSAGLKNWVQKRRFCAGKTTATAASAEKEAARAEELGTAPTHAEQRASAKARAPAVTTKGG